MGFKPRSIEARIVRDHGAEALERIGFMIDQGDPGLAAALAGTRDAFERVAVAAGAALAAMADNGGSLMHITSGDGPADIDALIDEATSEIDIYNAWDRLHADAAELLERPAPDAGVGTPLFAIMLASFERSVRPRIIAALARHDREANR